MKFKKYSSWLLLGLAAILPLTLIVLYAIGLELLTGQQFTGEDFLTNPAFAVIIGISHTSLFLILLHFLRKQGSSLADIGWKGNHVIREMGMGILLGFGLYLFKEVALDSFTAVLHGRNPTFHSLFNFQFKSKDMYLMIVAVVFPFVEESIFRGYPLQKWRHKWPVWKILVISSLLFGLMHVLGGDRDFSSGLNATILGALYFGIFFWRKSLFTSTASHSFYNLLIVLT